MKTNRLLALAATTTLLAAISITAAVPSQANRCNGFSSNRYNSQDLTRYNCSDGSTMTLKPPSVSGGKQFGWDSNGNTVSCFRTAMGSLRCSK